MPEGIVKWFSVDRGYGFIAPKAGGRDIFVHLDAVKASGRSDLPDGAEIQFEIEPAKDGRIQAKNLVLHSMRENGEASTRYTGHLVVFKTKEGFGFIKRTDGGMDVFVHISALQEAGLVPDELIQYRQELQFSIHPDRRRRDAGRFEARDIRRIFVPEA